MKKFIHSRLAQASLEFVVLFVFALIIISLGLYLVGFFTLEFSKQEAVLYRDDIALLIIEEFNIYEKVEGGYSRDFFVPSFVNTNYNITLNSASKLLIIRDYLLEDGSIEHYYDLPLSVEFNSTYDVDGNLIITLFKNYSENLEFVLPLEDYTYTPNIFSCSSLPYGEWIKVPGNSFLGTNDFCVMKYEAKNNSNVVSSLPSGFFWTEIIWEEAKNQCNSLGPNFHLITDSEWLTISKNIEQNASNWNSSVVGIGFVYSGHNDGNPPNVLNASSDDLDGYYGTQDSEVFPGDGNFSGYTTNDPRAYMGQKRTLILSNGEVIWDFAGNLWEWVDYFVYSNSTLGNPFRYHGGDAGVMTYNDDLGLLQASLVPSYMVPSNNWDAGNGMGTYKDGDNILGSLNQYVTDPNYCSGHCSNITPFRRGGSWIQGQEAGIFSLSLTLGEYAPNFRRSFRCTYTP